MEQVARKGLHRVPLDKTPVHPATLYVPPLYRSPLIYLFSTIRLLAAIDAALNAGQLPSIDALLGCSLGLFPMVRSPLRSCASLARQAHITSSCAWEMCVGAASPQH